MPALGYHKCSYPREQVAKGSRKAIEKVLLNFLRLLLFRLGNYDAAEKLLEKARITRDHVVIGQLAMIYRQKGRLEQSHGLYEQSLLWIQQKTDPDEEVLGDYQRRLRSAQSFLENASIAGN